MTNELKFKVLGDFSDFKRELQNLFKTKFKVGAGAESSSGGEKPDKESKKGLGILGGISAKLGGILAILLSLKPIQDLLKIIFNFIVLGFLETIKFFKNLPENLAKLSIWIWEKLKVGFNWLKEKLSEGWNLLKEVIAGWWTKAIDWLKALPGKIWEFLKALPGQIWEFLVQGFTWIKDKLVEGWNLLKEVFINLKNSLVEKFLELKEKFVEKILELRDKLVEKFLELKEKFVEKIVELRDKLVEKFLELKEKFDEKIVELKDKFIEWIGNLWQSIKDLPDNIWNSIKTGFDDIVSAIKNFFKPDKEKSSSSSSSKSDSTPTHEIPGGKNADYIARGTDKFGKQVNDAIITKTGQVIETHPEDNIIATKSLGGMGGSTTINFYGLTMDEAIDKVKRELAVAKIKSTRF